MTVRGQENHYNVKLLKGYGVSINLNSDRKRFCLETLKSRDDSIRNDSVPMSLNYTSKEKI